MTSVKWDASKTVTQNAAEKLPEMARQFFDAGGEAAAPDTSYAAMHRFRLLTKRFRYTLELFRRYYGPSLERRIESLRSVQQLLGEISDCSATQDLLAKRKDLSASEGSILEQKLDRVARIRVAKFRRNWSDEFSPRRQTSWIRYLARGVRRRRASNR